MTCENRPAPARAGGPDAGGPRISVIIPHLDDLLRLAECIAALDQQTLPRHAFEIIVADNGSRFGLEAVRAAAAGALVVDAPERGAGPARNAGASYARGEILAFTDADCRPDRDWLAAGLQSIGNGADIAGGSVDLSVRDPGQPTPAESFERVFSFDNARYIADKGFSVTANLFTRRAAFERVGPFACGLPEDFDWCRRARHAGFKIAFAPDARVGHPARATYSDLAAKWDRLTREAYADHVLAGRSEALWLLRAIAVLASPMAHAWRVLTSPRLASRRERMGALGVLVRIRARRAAHMVGLSWSRLVGVGLDSSLAPAAQPQAAKA